MSSENVLDLIEDDVLVLTLNRPEKMNALTGGMYRRLTERIEAAQQDPQIAVILIRAEGENFTAGNDIGDFLELGAEARRPVIDEVPSIAFLLALNASRKPIVAAVQGLAFGVGLTMLLHCDFVYCAESAILKAPFVELGLVPEAGSSWILPRLLGRKKANQIFIDGAEMSAAEAHRLGVASHIFGDDELQTVALQHARSLARKPREAMLRTREMLHEDREAIAERIREEAAVFLERLQSEEVRQAFSSFMDRSRA